MRAALDRLRWAGSPAADIVYRARRIVLDRNARLHHGALNHSCAVRDRATL